MEQSVGIFVLPSRPGVPPRALVFDVAEAEQLAATLIDSLAQSENDSELMEVQLVGARMATWSADIGSWTVEGIPIPPGLSEAITQQAKELGVKW